MISNHQPALCASSGAGWMPSCTTPGLALARAAWATRSRATSTECRVKLGRHKKRCGRISGSSIRARSSAEWLSLSSGFTWRSTSTRRPAVIRMFPASASSQEQWDHIYPLVAREVPSMHPQVGAREVPRGTKTSPMRGARKVLNLLKENFNRNNWCRAPRPSIAMGLDGCPSKTGWRVAWDPMSLDRGLTTSRSQRSPTESWCCRRPTNTIASTSKRTISVHCSTRHEFVCRRLIACAWSARRDEHGGVGKASGKSRAMTAPLDPCQNLKIPDRTAISNNG